MFLTRSFASAAQPNYRKPFMFLNHIPSQSDIRGGSGQEIRTCRLASEPLSYLINESTQASLHSPCRMGQNLWIHLPYLTSACTYQPYTVARINIMHGVTHVTIQEAVHPNTSRIERMVIHSIRIHYVSCQLHYIPSCTTSTKRRDPDQSKSCKQHIFITMQNGLHFQQRYSM